jgi:hypothetical protein
MKKLFFIPVILLLSGKPLLAQTEEVFPKMDKLTILDKNMRFEIEIEDLRWLQEMPKDSLLTWFCHDIASMAKKYSDTKPPLQFTYKNRSIGVNDRFVKIDSVNLQAERYESAEGNAVTYTNFKYKIQLNLGKPNSPNPANSIADVLFLSKKKTESNVKSSTYSTVKDSKPKTSDIGDRRSRRGTISLSVFTEKPLEVYQMSRLDTILNKLIDDAYSAGIPKRHNRSVEARYASDETSTKPFEKQPEVIINQLTRDYWYFAEGIGLSSIAQQWIPRFDIKFMRGFANRTGKNTEIGLSATAFFMSDANDNYKLHSSTFLNLNYRMVLLPLNNRSGEITLGYLVSHDGDFFRNDTFRFGVATPISKRTTLNFAVYGNSASSRNNNNSGMYEVGLTVWLP